MSESRHVTIDASDVVMLLEYAYLGDARNGGSCHRESERDEYCVLCCGFTAIETALAAVLPPDEMPMPEWWRETRWWRRFRRRG